LKRAESLWLFYVSGAMLGVGFAGGSIAWNIGHQDFASPERDALYMSVHVTLNGIRGVIAPFAAVALYKWLNASGVSHLTFAVCFAVNIVGAAGFVLQWRGMRAKMAAHADPGVARSRGLSDDTGCLLSGRHGVRTTRNPTLGSAVVRGLVPKDPRADEVTRAAPSENEPPRRTRWLPRNSDCGPVGFSCASLA